MPQPADGPADREAVKVQLKITDESDDAVLDDIVAAVNALVRGWPVAQLPDDVDAWPENVVHGANMLAGRLFRRRNSPSGVEAFGTNGPVYVQRNDPDIAMMLQLGDYSRPSVG